MGHRLVRAWVGLGALALLFLAAFTAAATAAVLSAGAVAREAPATEFTQMDLEKVRGAEACGECHVDEFAVWEGTAHATGFKTLHRKEAAEQIAERLGFPLIKRDSICLRCHYTPELETARDGSPELRARSGVSCESCHGEAADWIDVHNDYGGKGVDHTTEGREHREMRISSARAAGMRRPDDLYELAASCYECHFVPHEELVNVGGHSTGAATFDLWERSQGDIRHNFIVAQRGGSAENAVRGIDRRREFEVVAAALAVEYSLRGAARATQDAVYLKAMQRRLRGAISDLREIQRRLGFEEFATMVRAARSVRAEENNAERLLNAADTVRQQTQQLLARTDPGDLRALDDYLLGRPESDLPELPEEPEPEPEATTSGTDPAAEVGAGATGSEPESLSTAATGDLPLEAAEEVTVVGEKKTRVHAASSHRTLGGACSSCHAPQNEWWFGDAHYESADRLFDSTPRAVEIAHNYGVSSRDMVRGNNVCTDCHATVISGRESREVQDGVGCESCHGAAGDYLEPHKEGEKELGAARPGYVQALRLGMRELADLDVRLRTCSGCHYINDERLISSGHPSGVGFDFASGMNTIRHWEDPPEPSSAIRSAASRALAARGPVPDVPIKRTSAPARRARPAAAQRGTRPSTTATASGAAAAPAPERAEGTTGSRRETLREPSSERAADDEAPVSDASAAGEAVPIDPDAPLDELLEAVKERLDALDRQAPPPPQEEP